MSARVEYLAKTYIFSVDSDSLLERLTSVKNDMRMMLIKRKAPNCANDCEVGADILWILHSLLDIGVDRIKLERYII